VGESEIIRGSQVLPAGTAARPAAFERIELNRIQRPIFPDTGVHVLSSIVGADTVKKKGCNTSRRGESGCSQNPGATNCFKEVLVAQVCRGGPQRVCGLAD